MKNLFILFIAALFSFVTSSALAEGGPAKAGHSAKPGEHETAGASHWPVVHPALAAKKSLVAKPEAVKGLSPEFFTKVSGDNTDLKWQASEGADVYHVQVAEDAGFKWLLVNEHLYKGTSYKVTGLKAGQKYFWRVAGVKSDNDAGYIKGYYGNSMFLAK